MTEICANPRCGREFEPSASHPWQRFCCEACRREAWSHWPETVRKHDGNGYKPIRAGDLVWPTDNELGIPRLDPEVQANGLDAPFVKWGTVARRKAHASMGGTWHFYTDDSKFDGLWRHPELVALSGCVSVIEPNFSVGPQAPRAVAIWQTYRKRWLARYWQAQGIRVFVDLNVPIEHAVTNLTGVPAGWRAFATRGYTHYEGHLIQQFDIASEIAGAPILFVVYGGGREIQRITQQRGLLWFPDHAREVCR